MTRSNALLRSVLAVALAPALASGQTDLAPGFRHPPARARPHTWWHWMNGNITREGITADLEAMSRIGLGGAQIFNVSEAIPEGPVGYMSPEWRALVKHAVQEADRLGIELCMHNCAGWSSSGGPWITPEYAMQIVVTSETRVTGPRKLAEVIPQPETRRAYYQDIAVLAWPTPADDTRRIAGIAAKAGHEARYGLQPSLDEFPADAIVAPSAIVDLTAGLAAGGRLEWDVPAGDWTIVRFGHTPTGKDNHPSPESGRGLECDKLSRQAMDVHWAGMMGPVIADLGPLAGRVLNNALIDSYEVGPQNWTARFRDEFRARRGYDLLPWLPTLTGRVVESGEASERFLWDFRRTIADLFADNYFGYFAERCRGAGLQMSVEPYDGPFECLLAGRDADIPMGEFWVGGGESSSCKLAASVAHTYGRRIVGAEAFTADPNTGRWQNHPYSLKAIGDLMYCAGINRYIMHRYAHQPWLDRVPGMTMGQWGTHFERTVTWWDVGGPWVTYLSRCQQMLQQGLFVADVCFFAGEGAPNGAPHHPGLKAAGYDYDACNADVLLRRASVQDGRLALADGMSYRVLVLPDTAFMTPRLLAKIRDLVAQGATVIGPKPSKSPSLTDRANADREVQRLANEVWGDCDGVAVKEHTLGAGRVVWGRAPAEVLAATGSGPDCAFAPGGGTPPKMAWIHRVAEGTDIYFVSNQKPYAIDVQCTFRIAGRRPELWYADTGAMELAPVWSEASGRTTVPIRFDPAGSVFVVFRRPSQGAEHAVSLRPPGAPPTPAGPPKIEIHAAWYEAIDGAGGADVTEKVRSLVAAGETTIPANNGTFGDPAYMHVKRLRVEYSLNGQRQSRAADENAAVELVEERGDAGPPPFRLALNERGQAVLDSFVPGTFRLGMARGPAVEATIGPVAPPVQIAGPWTVTFPPHLGAPPSITLDRLVSWTEHADAGVQYFSGTGAYSATFELADAPAPGTVLELDLGRVACIAEVRVNDRDLGIWWKPPFAADVTSIVRRGRNTLSVRVTNLWVNRLIGDEQLPEDVEWNGKPLKQWPEWLTSGAPRPAPGRVTFTTWRHYTRESPLLESGLLGPVTLRTGQRVTVGPR